MVAIALQDKYPKATYIRVDANTIRLTLDGLRYCFITPPKVKKYILDFDKLGAEAIKPFSFVTRARARVHRAGLYGTHPNWDNALRPPRKKYDPALKMRRYAKKTRVNGVCRLVPV
jgi:hypothetical protein